MTHPADFDGLDYRTLTRRLRKSYPEPEVDRIIDEVKKYRKQRKNEHIHLCHARQRWGDLIAGLQHERKIVRTMLRYKPTSLAPERQEFVQAYAQVLDTLHARLCLRRDTTNELPEHDHWVDYVPERIKMPLRMAQENIPARTKARTKAPFERRIPSAIHKRVREKLLRNIQTEKDNAQRMLNINPDDAKAVNKLLRLNKALDTLNKMHPSEPLPNTWHGLLSNPKGKNEPLSTKEMPDFGLTEA